MARGRPTRSTLPYPVARPGDWGSVTGVGAQERLRLRALDLRRFRHAAKTRQVSIRQEQSARLPVGRSAPILLCVLRNAAARLPSFLAHYRGLGVARFAILDDRSRDDTRALLAEPDIDVFASDVDYAGAARGLAWRDLMLGHYGRGRWYLSVDVDEYLVYPGCEAQPLAAFIADLARHGLTRSAAVMLDLYPDAPLDRAPAHEPREAFPTAVAPMHDGDGYWLKRRRRSLSVQGGPRHRLFGAGVDLEKFPLFLADRRTRLAGGKVHSPFPYERNFAAKNCVLLHYRFTPGSGEEFRRIAERGMHTDAGGLYRRMLEHPRFGAGLDLRYPGSVRYTDSAALLRHGFMTDLRG